MAFSDIDALHGYLAAISALSLSIDSANVQYPNTEFSPVDGTPWMRVTRFPDDSYVATLGDLGECEEIGHVALELFYPSGNGDAAARADLDILHEILRPGLNGTSGLTYIIITKATRTGGRIENNWFSVTYNYYYRCRYPRIESA